MCVFLLITACEGRQAGWEIMSCLLPFRFSEKISVRVKSQRPASASSSSSLHPRPAGQSSLRLRPAMAHLQAMLTRGDAAMLNFAVSQTSPPRGQQQRSGSAPPPRIAEVGVQPGPPRPVPVGQPELPGQHSAQPIDQPSGQNTVSAGVAVITRQVGQLAVVSHGAVSTSVSPPATDIRLAASPSPVAAASSTDPPAPPAASPPR